MMAVEVGSILRIAVAIEELDDTEAVGPIEGRVLARLAEGQVDDTKALGNRPRASVVSRR